MRILTPPICDDCSFFQKTTDYFAVTDMSRKKGRCKKGMGNMGYVSPLFCCEHFNDLRGRRIQDGLLVISLSDALNEQG